MAVITKIEVLLSGWQGGPGMNTFFALDVGQGTPNAGDVEEFATEIMAMYDTLKTYRVQGVTALVNNEAESYDVETGNLVAVHSFTAPTANTGLNTNDNLSRATMAKFRYRTNAIVNNRLLQGGIYYGPLAGSAISDDGSLEATFIAAVTTAHNGLLDVVGPLRLAAWHRPVNKANGAFGYVQSVTAKRLPAVLRSRRD